MLNLSTGELVGMRCKSWRCEVCTVSNGRAARKRIRMGLLEDEGIEVPKFLTLTSRPGEAPHESIATLTRKYENLTRHLRRSFPTARIEYAGVPERTKRGALHFHVALRGVPYLPQPVWSRLAARFGFGSIVWVEKIRGAGGMSAYMTKSLGGYMTKDLGRFVWPPGFRRLRFSQSWALGWVSRGRRTRQPGDHEDAWQFVRLEMPPRPVAWEVPP